MTAAYVAAWQGGKEFFDDEAAAMARADGLIKSKAAVECVVFRMEVGDE